MNCTWEGCTEEALHPQVGQDGQQWANLCPAHDELLRRAVEDVDHPQRMLGYWVKAQGGAKVATDRMQPAIDAGARLFEILSKR